MRSISRNDVIRPKPAAEPFLRAAYLAGVDPAEAVAVDDSWTGVTAGLAAGMRTIFWPERPMEGPAGAIVVNSAEQLRYELGL
jgi:beta-phosphoglucomutase-like phosphatase (HAD superfamily)